MVSGEVASAAQPPVGEPAREVFEVEVEVEGGDKFSWVSFPPVVWGARRLRVESLNAEEREKAAATEIKAPLRRDVRRVDRSTLAHAPCPVQGPTT